MKERFSKRPVSPSVNEDVYVSIDVTGKTHRLHVGEHGVTREWIQRLRRMDRRDRDSNRKYYSKSDGRRFTRILYSLDELSWDEMERTPFLIDEDSDVEQLFIMKEERDERKRRIRKAYEALNPKQRILAWAVYIKDMPQRHVAKLLHIDPTSLRDRLKVIKKKLLEKY